MSGKLFLVATPIGNLKDITLRAVETLQNVDIIACEDTRQTIKLLNHLNIKKRMISYFEHNKIEKGKYLVSLLKEGNDIALVSDAGTPAISDPGEDLVKLCIENNIVVSSIPGAVAFISGLVMSGLFTGRFVFEGFLPVNKRSKKERLEELKNEKRTLIFYEAPHKIKKTLTEMIEILGDRNIVLARELTKIHEEVTRTTISESLEIFKEKPPKGEYVLLLEGYIDENIDNQDFVNISSEEIKSKIDNLISFGESKKDAMKILAKELNLPKRQIYMHYIDKI